MPPQLQANAGDPGPEPPVMTWGKALPVLAVLALFDAMRFVFEWFALFGPVLAGTAAAGWLSQYLWGPLATAIGAGVAIGTGAFGSEVYEAFGLILAIMVGLMGWLAFFTILLVVNWRIFKVNPFALISLVAGFLISETPFLGSIPAISGTAWRLYRTQIKTERAAHKAWQARKEAFERRRQEQLDTTVTLGHAHRAAAAQTQRNQRLIDDMVSPEALERFRQEQPGGANEEIPEREYALP